MYYNSSPKINPQYQKKCNTNMSKILFSGIETFLVWFYKGLLYYTLDSKRSFIMVSSLHPPSCLFCPDRNSTIDNLGRLSTYPQLISELKHIQTTKRIIFEASE